MALSISITFALAAAGCRQSSVNPRHVSAAAITSNTSPELFADVTARSGITYQWKGPGKRPANVLDTIGNGCAFLDYDNDGNLDILLIGPQLALYKGDGKGSFTDVTHQLGLDKLHGHFLGCAVGDYDGDGYDDVYVSGFQTGLLLHNDHGRRFVDVTKAAGMKPQPWGTSCAWMEENPGSGRLDLYVANYVAFQPGSPKYKQLCDSHGTMTACGPRFYTPLHGVFYRQSNGGTFTDASKYIGIPRTNGRGLGVAVATLDDSGRPVIALANDEMPGDLLMQEKGEHSYENVAVGAGTAYDRDGNIHGGMGTDWGDYDNDGQLDLFVGTFQGETKSLYHNDGNNLFSDASYQVGIAAQTIPNVTFGCKFVDFDNDGWLDLIIANGHVQDNIHALDTSTDYRQPIQLFKNEGRSPAAFADLSRSAGPAFDRPIVGRGVAIGDFDNDGREDVLIVDSEGAPLLLHNGSPSPGHWLRVELVGTQSNRDGLGSVLTLGVGEHSYVRQCQTSGSYLSASDKRVHFGLGASAMADALSIRWPDGHIDTLHNIPADQSLRVEEGGKVLAGHVAAAAAHSPAVVISSPKPAVPSSFPQGAPPFDPRQPLQRHIVPPVKPSTPTKINVVDGAEMIYIPAGGFIMGSTTGNTDEQPPHPVSLDGFYIYKNLVTVAQYRKFCKTTHRIMPPAPPWGWEAGDLPMVNVTWNDAHSYAAWAGGALPTEAQWEKAARGTDGREYPWGNSWDPSLCCHSDRSFGDVGGPSPVGSYPYGASPYGILDMAGNVWEWCNDWYGENYYASSPVHNPAGPQLGTNRVLRGGSWLSVSVYNFRSAYRDSNLPTYKAVNDGFRCVVREHKE